MSISNDRTTLMRYDAESQIKAELDASEHLLWSGRPLRGIRFRRSDLLNIPFGLLYGWIAISLEAGVITQHAPVDAVLWGIPFVLFGLYLIVGRFLFDAALRGTTVYAITSQRVLIASGVLWHSIQSFDIATLTDVALVERNDRSGDVVLGGVPYWQRPLSVTWPGLFAPFSLEMVVDARQAYDALREALHDARPRTRVGLVNSD